MDAIKGKPTAKKVTKGFAPAGSETITPEEALLVRMSRVSSNDPNADIKHTLTMLANDPHDQLEKIGHRNSLVIESLNARYIRF
jgi:hypothetical protein